MKYSCTECGYIHETSIDESLFEGFCPVCSNDFSDFIIIKEECNYIDLNSSFLSFIEREHIINIKKNGEEKINITVGFDGSHPMVEGHYISEIIILDEYGDIIEEDFFTETSDNNFDFTLDYLDLFEVRIRCNIHGLWSTGIINL